MTDNNLIGQQVQGYTITKKLGSGGYGTVYLGVKEDLGKQYQTAIKHISIPDAEGYESVLQDYGYDKDAAQVHFEKMVEGITSEINTLLELSKKDNRYIVAYYDHDIQKSLDPLHFDIFMRMEYLTPLNLHIRQNGITIGELIKLGLNKSDALSLCHGSGVIHRDIKEANIFINESGHFKLGDFGVAKAAIEITRSGSIKGTASYMAPEIYLREPYDSSVDIYSLGIVLYKLLNNQRIPFMPDAPAPFTADDKNVAETRRLKGEKPPLPANAKNRLGEIVVKACSAKSERYTNAEDFKKDLQEFLSTIEETEYDRVVAAQAADGDEYVHSGSGNTEQTYSQTQGATVTMGAQNGNPQAAPPISAQNPYAEKPKKKRKRLVIASVIGVAVIAAGIAGYVAISKMNDPLKRFQEAVLENDFVKAAQLYQEKLKSGNSEKLAEAVTFITDQAEAIKGYKDELIASLSEFESDKRYKDAISALKEGLLVVPDDADFLAEIADYEKKIEDDLILTIDGIIRDAKSVVSESDDYTTALTDLRAAEKQYPNQEEIKTAISEIEESYVARELTEAEKLANDSKYEDAVERLGEALKLSPDNELIEKAIKEYKAKYPALLQQMVYFVGENLGNGGQELDNVQNMQINIVTTSSTINPHFDNVYKLNGKYKKITGNWYQPFDRRSDTKRKVLKIYGDGRLLFSSKMGAGIEPVNFSVDLTGIEELEIISIGEKWADAGYAKLANVQLYQ